MRALEPKKELPLDQVEIQPYIHYNKGSVVMYALQDYIGEDQVNAALRAFLRETAFKGPPYANSPRLMAHLEAVTPNHLKYLLDDFFRSITLYENRAVSATARPLGNGKYELLIKAKAKKVRADALGVQNDVPVADWIDFGALDDKGLPLLLERHKVDSPNVEVKMVVDRLPVKAGIDPLNKLIDRKPKDNLVRVEKLIQ